MTSCPWTAMTYYYSFQMLLAVGMALDWAHFIRTNVPGRRLLLRAMLEVCLPHVSALFGICSNERW